MKRVTSNLGGSPLRNASNVPVNVSRGGGLVSALWVH